MLTKSTPVTDATFKKDVLKSDVPVLVDFWAGWCGPCKIIAPIVEEIAAEYEGKITVLKLDVDENQVSPTTYVVRSIPTLIIFKDGQEVARVVGAVTKLVLENALNEVLA